MYIKLFQAELGRFNLLSNEESFTFTLALVNEFKSRQPIEVDGIKAILHFSGTPQEAEWFENPLENLNEVYKRCFNYSNKVWSTTNYKAQCLLFLKLYKENYELIDNNHVAIHKEKTAKKILELQKEMEWNTIIPDISDDIDWEFKLKIKEKEKKIEYWKNELAQYVNPFEKFTNTTKTIERIQAEIDELKSYLTK